MKQTKAEQLTRATEPSSCLIMTSKPMLMPTDPRSTASNDNSKDRQLAWQVADNVLASFRYAWAGIHYAFTTQRNFRIHTVVAILAISLGIYLGIAAIKMAIVTLTCAMVMALELINTAIESLVDLTVKQSYHELAKIAKDCAAGAVLVSAFAAVIVAAFILLPPLLNLLI